MCLVKTSCRIRRPTAESKTFARVAVSPREKYSGLLGYIIVHSLCRPGIVSLFSTVSIIDRGYQWPHNH